MKPVTMLVMALLFGTLSLTAHAQDDAGTQTWLPTLITATPQEGFDLAVTLARRGVGTTQRDADVRSQLRPAYAHDADSLIAASQVIAIHYQTIAAANNYWRDNQ